ncbi:hypothetical protein DMA11_12090 [Marinilabiliaceae bacterium JC017]|nr:hypothetical protein DMA11_12090 [Marinilabiliaceae bacterium JC017]
MGQVKIPRTTKGLSDLVGKINTKNNSDGEQSILNSVVSMDAIKTKVDEMLDFEMKANEANRLKEEMNEQKKKAMREITKEMQRVRNLLKAQYPDDLRKLGAWGFDVDNVSKKKVGEIA